jgi:hypothetical protein
MSSWGLAAGWLAVCSTALLTIGTGAQAWANLTEFKTLRQAVGKEAWDAYVHPAASPERRLPPVLVWLGLRPLLIPYIVWRTWFDLLLMFRLPKALTKIRAEGGDDAVQLAQFLRLAEVWVTLMIGSALALAAALIQLVHA